jgi:hypothetical protein
VSVSLDPPGSKRNLGTIFQFHVSKNQNMAIKKKATMAEKKNIALNM